MHLVHHSMIRFNKECKAVMSVADKRITGKTVDTDFARDAFLATVLI